MEPSKLSIIIPVYNVALYLPMCLDSVLSQTLREIDIICVNDGSTDNSLNILCQYADRDPRIKIIDSKINEGIGIARNKGMKVAEGGYIAFIDSDDWIAPNMYQVMYEAADKNGIDIVMCAMEQYSADGQIILQQACSYSTTIPRVLDDNVFTWRDIHDDIFTLLPVCWNKIYNRQFLKNSEFEFSQLGDGPRSAGDERFEGLLFSYSTLLSAKKMRFVRRPFYKWRRQREGAITATRSARPKSIFEVFQILDQRLAMHEFNEQIRQHFEAAKVQEYFQQLHRNDEDSMPAYFNILQRELKRVNLHNPRLKPKNVKRIEFARDNSLSDFLEKEMVMERELQERRRSFRYKIGRLIDYGAALPVIGPVVGACLALWRTVSKNGLTKGWRVLRTS
jgi:glycosyltransferase involved in cell wall biosynthesis